MDVTPTISSCGSQYLFFLSPIKNQHQIEAIGACNTYLFCMYNQKSTPNETSSTTSLNHDVSKRN